MDSPSPSPSPDPALEQAITLFGEFGVLAVTVAAIMAMGVMVMFAAMLLRASRYRWPVPIIAPLAMLTLVFGVLGVFAQSLVALAGAGIGALAGVLTSQLGKPGPSDNRRPANRIADESGGTDDTGGVSLDYPPSDPTNCP